MFKKIISILGSSKTTLALLFVFGFSCAYGTFFENDFGTDEVRAVVYNSWWFELVMALLMVNFILNLKKYNLLKREKITLFLFHFGFIIILVGAFISRYTGYEGLVNIREGQSVSHILSDKNYLTLEEDEGILFKKQVVPSAIRPTRFNETIPLNEKQVELQSIGFIPNAQEIIVDGEKRILELVLAENGARKTYFLHEDQRLNVNGNSIAFKKDLSNTVAIFYENDSLRIWSDSAIVFMNMLSQSTGSFEAGKTISLEYSTLYQVGSLAFVAVVMHENAGVNWQSSQDSELKKVLPGKLVINLKCDGKEQVHSLDYRKGSSSFRTLEIDNTKLKLALGPEKIQLGFQLHLTDFELKRYPGSTSPSEYSSHLEVINGNERFPYTIFMNNVLDHKGFRFFQASYDTDELGTILSVNHDKAGTLFTYLGYFILGLGMVLSLFSKSTRFQFIIRSLSKIKAKKASLTAVLIALTLVGVSQNRAALSKKASIYSTELTDEFGSLLVQDMDGRIKPVNTLASELLRKLTGKTKFEFLVENETFEIDPNQFMLAVHAKPMFWAQMPLIAIDDEKGDIIFDALGKDKVRFLEFREFFDSDGHYLLEKQVETAHRTKTSDRSVFDKEVVKVDERFNILYKALSDSYLKLFPRPNDQEKHWFSDKGMLIGYPSEDSLFVKNILNMLFASGDSAITVGNWEQSIQYAKYIGKYQNTIAADIVPSSARIQTELFYNKANVFLHLFYSYWLFGALLLTLSVVSLFKRSKVLSVVKNVSAVIVFILFLFHTANIIIRWYAGGYPP
ncbi:MAG: cytochrome c biogenesis protein ResB, partial [Bacteroidia bacterium]